MKRPVFTVALLAVSIRVALAAGQSEPRVEPPVAPASPAVPAAAQAEGPGYVTGTVTGPDGVPVALAEVEVAGADTFVFTGEDGTFTAQVPPGTYTVNIRAGGFADRSESITVAPQQILALDLQLQPPAADAAASAAAADGQSEDGDRELETVEVEEQVIAEGTSEAITLDRQFSAQVVDAIGAEQISRAGDSDAALAIKRITGLTLVDDQFVYVRGLGERYSSVLLNGAQIPSPDPTRRVVPLDLFPTEVLDSITVQKTYSADLPGEFTGGTVLLRTKAYPSDFQMRASTSVGYDESATGEDGLTYRGGDRDWQGRDDGAREFPDELFRGRLNALPDADQERVAEQLAGQGYRVYERNIDPNASIAFNVGDSFGGDDVRFGYSASLRHSQEWDNRIESLKSFSIINGEVNPTPTEEFERRRTERAIDSSGFLTLGAEFGANHSIDAALLLLRQTTDDTRIDEGYDTSPSDIEQRYLLEWIENELMVKQFSGEHRLPALADLDINWQYTRSDVSRFEPNTREYQYGFQPQQNQFVLTRGSQGNNQLAAQLDDQTEELRLGLSLPLQFGDNWFVTVNGGHSELDRDRESIIRRYRYRIGTSPLLQGLTDIEDYFSPIFIGTDPSLVELEDNFQATDFYTAGQDLGSTYLGTEIAYGEAYRLNLGVRREDNDLQVTTLQPFFANATPEIGAIEGVDYLPSATFTWAYTEQTQVRAGYSETLARPDFRELTRAPFTDPLLDITTQGNPDLIQTDIRNYDLRWEHYFSASESLSFALFLKEFDNPIEIVRVPGTGELLEPQNAEEATNYGLEVDYFKSLVDLRRWDWLEAGWLSRVPWESLYVGFNYAWIDSEVTLGDDIIGIQTTDNRPLQGQSPYVVNFQLGYREPDGKREATLLYNVFGERIAGVGVRGLPDIYEEPLHQLDFVYSQRFQDSWRFRVRLRNLLDEKVEFTQGGFPTRSYRKGRDVTLSLEYTW